MSTFNATGGKIRGWVNGYNLLSVGDWPRIDHGDLNGLPPAFPPRDMKVKLESSSFVSKAKTGSLRAGK